MLLVKNDVSAGKAPQNTQNKNNASITLCDRNRPISIVYGECSIGKIDKKELSRMSAVVQ